MRIRTHVLLSVFPVAAMLLSACDKSNNAEAPASSADARVTTPSATMSALPVASVTVAPPASAAKPEGGHPRGGAAMLLRIARDLPDLKEPQKATVDKLEGTLTSDESMKTELKGMNEDMIAGIRAGKIDTAKMQAHYAAIEKAAQARQDKEADALNGLYATLDPVQRKAVVASVRAKQVAREDKEKEHEKMMGDAGAAEWNKRRLERLTKELSLDDAQQKQVAALLAKQPTPAQFETVRADVKKRNDALLTAFEKEGFDAKKLDLSMMPGKKPHEMLDQHVQFLSGLLGILKPEQREKLAVSMEKAGHWEMPMGDRPMGFGPGMPEERRGE